MDNCNLGSFSDSWSGENEVRSGESIYSNSRDYTTEFTTDQIFESREDMINWAKRVGIENNMVIVIKNSANLKGGKLPKCHLMCEIGGKYKPPLYLVEGQSIVKNSGTKKCECPFELRGIPKPPDGVMWGLKVTCGFHNHQVAEYLDGHEYPSRLKPLEKQFRAEVSTIGNIQHVNLVRLRGFCSEGTKKLLVYDYMPNSSLDSNLFPGKDSKVLDWKTRYQIALGTARGLVYLHEKCRDCIIHCDIKPENILLDAEWCPKVADFGLAKLVGREFSRVLTTIRGTRGYLAPEWISGVAITTKADVYSYGMMLFEIVSGRRNVEYNSQYSGEEEMKYFPSWAASLMSEGGNVLSLLDTRLQGNADVEELSRICKVACWCVQDDETQRPSIGQVVQILEGVLEVTLSPIPRSLQLVADNQDDIIFFTESSENSGASSQQVPKSLQR